MAGKKSIALLSIGSNCFLVVLKFFAGVFTGSISLLSEALHSLGDLLASVIAFVSVVEGSKPADKEHPMGHSKFEDMAGFIEALLIIASAFFIFYVGFEKIILKNASYAFNVDIAFYVMIFSVVLNFIVAKMLLHSAKVHNSSALLGDGAHLMADVYSSLAIVLGLFIVKVTGNYILDPIIAIVVAGMILKTGLTLAKDTSSNLLDTALPEENLTVINNVLALYKDIVEVKSIRAYKSGSMKNIILIIYLDCNMTLKDAHKLMDEIENRIEAELTKTDIIIHAEPKAESILLLKK